MVYSQGSLFISNSPGKHSHKDQISWRNIISSTLSIVLRFRNNSLDGNQCHRAVCLDFHVLDFHGYCLHFLWMCYFRWSKRRILRILKSSSCQVQVKADDPSKDGRRIPVDKSITECQGLLRWPWETQSAGLVTLWGPHNSVREVLHLVLFLYHDITLVDHYSPCKILNRLCRDFQWHCIPHNII